MIENDFYFEVRLLEVAMVIKTAAENLAKVKV